MIIPKCPYCMDAAYGRHIAMKRLYIRVKLDEGRRYVPIGWICPKCGYHFIDAEPPLIKGRAWHRIVTLRQRESTTEAYKKRGKKREDWLKLLTVER